MSNAEHNRADVERHVSHALEAAEGMDEGALPMTLASVGGAIAYALLDVADAIRDHAIAE